MGPHAWQPGAMSDPLVMPLRPAAPRRDSGRVHPVRAAVLAACVALTACSSSTPHPKPVTGAAASAGVVLRTRVLGSGAQIVVLLHGGPGLSLEEMTPYDQLLSNNRTLVSFDQRGAGRTGSPPSGDLGLAAQVADVDAVRISRHADRVWLLGQSWGGLLAAAYAAVHPDRVAGLVLIDAAPPDLDAFEHGQWVFQQRLRELQQRGVIPAPLPGPLHGSCLPTLHAELPVYAANPAQPPRQPAGVTCTAGTAAAVFAATVRRPVLAAIVNGLKTAHPAALILTGASDPFGPSWPAAWHRLLPRAPVVTVPHAGHNPVLEQPRDVIKAVNEFLHDAPNTTRS